MEIEMNKEQLQQWIMNNMADDVKLMMGWSDDI